MAVFRKAIKDCYSRARAHGVKPWLFVPFAAEAGVRACRDLGVRLTILRRQILPAEDEQKRSMRQMVDALYEAIGPQPCEFLSKQFDRTLAQSIDAQTGRTQHS